MKKDIREEVEKYVLESMKNLNEKKFNDKAEEAKVLDNIKDLMKILDNAEKNEFDFELSKSKLKNEETKIQNDFNINKRKINVDESRVNGEFQVNNRRIDVEEQKCENDLNINTQKINNERRKINNDMNVNNRKLNIEEIKNNVESIFKRNEERFKLDADMARRVEKALELGVQLTSAVLPIVLYNKWMKCGFEFEKEGTFTSTTFKNLIGKFKPGK